MAHQINVFAQNKPGRLEQLTKTLLDSNINIRAITITGMEDFGVVKLLVDNPEKAYQALIKEGFTAYMKEIIAVIMRDQPGGLHEICQAMGTRGINIEDAYGFVVQDMKTALLVMEVEKIPEAEKVLVDSGFKVLSDEELYQI